MPQPIILLLENVTKQYAGAAAPAVDQVNLKLHQGELLGLLGPSGCGKTTLLRLIAGFEQPDIGAITLAEEIVAGSGRWQAPERRDVGMVFQDYALFPHLTVAQNVAFGLKHHRRSRQFSATQRRERSRETIALVGLEGLETRYPHQLSGGQQQRVALARALAPEPALVLLDEPLSNLDVQVRLRLRQEIRAIFKRTGTTGIFVTHDQEEALSIADQVAVMRTGKIEQFGSPEALYQQPASRFVAEFVTQSNFLPAQWDGAAWETEIGRFTVAEPPEAHEGTLMIRQEDLRLVPDDQGSLVIRDRQFLGREYRYCVSSQAGHLLYVQAPATAPLPIGITVAAAPTETAVRVFPAGS